MIQARECAAATAPQVYGFMFVIYSKAYFNLLTATRTPIRADKLAVVPPDGEGRLGGRTYR